MFFTCNQFRVLGSLPVRGQIELAATGASSSMLNIGQATIMELRLPRPPMEEQLAIVAHLDSVMAQMRRMTTEAEATIAVLQERRSALISAAVTGQIDVRGLAYAPNTQDSIAASA